MVDFGYLLVVVVLVVCFYFEASALADCLLWGVGICVLFVCVLGCVCSIFLTVWGFALSLGVWVGWFVCLFSLVSV